MELIKKRRGHHWRRCALTIDETKCVACWVARTDVTVDRIANPCHVRRLGKIIAAATGPDKDVVCKMADDFVRVPLAM